MRAPSRLVILLSLCLAGHALAADTSADAEGEMARADIYMAQRNFQAAIAHYRAASILAPDRPGPYRGLGMAYYAAGQCADAIPVLEEYLRRKARDPWPQAVKALSDCQSQKSGSVPVRAPGTFRVTSDPPGAEVRVDDEAGDLLGYTPYESESVRVGPHRVYLNKPDFRPAAGEVRVQSGAQATLHVLLSPLQRSLSPDERRQLAEDAAQRRREVGEYEQTQALEQGLQEQVRVRFEREKIEVSGSGPEYAFRDVNGAITENAFVRRYKKVAAATDLNFALKLRNKTAIAVWTTFGLLGVGLIGYGAATLTRHCQTGDGGDTNCTSLTGGVDTTKTTTDSTSETVLLAGLGVQLGSSLVFLIYGGIKPDGVPTQHYITEYDARLAAERYNRALQRRIRADLASGHTSREPAHIAPHILPYLGPGGMGIVGQF